MTTRSAARAAVLVAFALLGAAAAVVSFGRGAPAREIVLEAKDVSFGEKSGAIPVAPGERIRLVVKNTDPGILHAIAVPELGVDTLEIAPGEEISVEIVAPDEGSVEFVCPHHLPRMKGAIVAVP